MFQYLDDVRRGQFFKALLVLIILLAVFVGVKVVSSIKAYSYIGRAVAQLNVITVSGKGEVTAVPDTASFTYSVIEEGKTVAEAQDKASKKGNAIIAALKAMGIAEKDMQTTGYNSYPKYDYTGGQICINGSYCRPGKQVIVGYEVNQSVTVKVRKTADAGAALTKAGELGASNMSGLNFVVDDMDALRTEARDKAIADAKAKAKALAKSLGVDLARIVNFSESGNQPIPMYGGINTMNRAMMTSEATPPELPVGENKITSQVTITYELE